MTLLDEALKQIEFFTQQELNHINAQTLLQTALAACIHPDDPQHIVDHKNNLEALHINHLQGLVNDALSWVRAEKKRWCDAAGALEAKAKQEALEALFPKDGE